jgi:hypothetical protein
MKINKLAIGTAQFGMPYGIRNNEVGLKEIEKILDFAKKNKINTLDTAVAYKKAETKLGFLGVKEWKIISKIPTVPKVIYDEKKWINKIFFSSLKKLNLSRIDTILIHVSDVILNKNRCDKIFAALEELKRSKLIKNIGFSIYDPKKIEKIINRYELDTIQAPYNIFDQRILTSGLSKLLQKKKIKLHLRSIFLQGLLLSRNQNLPKIFRNNIFLLKFQKWVVNNNVNRIACCLGVTSKIKFEKLIIGLDNLKQLKEVIKSCKYRVKSFPNFNIKTNNKLIDPRKW